jgi:hypothetical protein
MQPRGARELPDAEGRRADGSEGDQTLPASPEPHQAAGTESRWMRRTLPRAFSQRSMYPFYSYRGISKLLRVIMSA